MGTSEKLDDLIGDLSAPKADPEGEPKLMFVTLTARLIRVQPGEKIQADRPVEISTEFVNLRRDQVEKSDLLKRLAPAAETTAVCGVFDPKQVEAARRDLEKAAGGSFSSGPTKTVAPSERYSVEANGWLHFPDKKDGAVSPEQERLNLQLEVQARAGVDSEIDLDIRSFLTSFVPAESGNAPDAKAGKASMEWKWREGALEGIGRPVTTSLSVFSGSMTVLARVVEGHPDYLQVLLITAKGTKEKPSAPESEPKREATPAADTAAGKLPNAIAVPGKPGFFISPFAPGMGMVDARGFPSGTQVKCPYSGKIFVIP